MSKEPIETLAPREKDSPLDLEVHGKQHVLYSGTRIVQHTPPKKPLPGEKAAPFSKRMLYLEIVYLLEID